MDLIAYRTRRSALSEIVSFLDALRTRNVDAYDGCLALLDLLVIRKARLQKVVDIHNLPIELDRSVVTRNEVAAAIEYVLNDDYDWPVSFVCVCGLLALDTDATRESLMKLVEDSKNPYVKAGLRIFKTKRHQT